MIQGEKVPPSWEKTSSDLDLTVLFEPKSKEIFEYHLETGCDPCLLSSYSHLSVECITFILKRFALDRLKRAYKLAGWPKGYSEHIKRCITP